jgi:hypothetical protein
MPSPLHTPIAHRSIALAVSIMAPVPAKAQQPSAQTSVAISIRVQPTLAIHGVLAGVARLDGGRLTATSIVNVESNLAYRVAVRLAPAAPTRAARVLVRNATGAFEPLAPGASVIAVASRTPGRHAHEVLCRVEAATADPLDAAPCPLVYELSAEHHDSLLSTTAIPDTKLREAGRHARVIPSGP